MPGKVIAIFLLQASLPAAHQKDVTLSVEPRKWPWPKAPVPQPQYFTAFVNNPQKCFLRNLH